MLKRGGRGDIFIDSIVKEVREPTTGAPRKAPNGREFESIATDASQATIVTQSHNGTFRNMFVGGGGFFGYEGQRRLRAATGPPSLEGPHSPGPRMEGRGCPKDWTPTREATK